MPCLCLCHTCASPNSRRDKGHSAHPMLRQTPTGRRTQQGDGCCAACAPDRGPRQQHHGRGPRHHKLHAGICCLLPRKVGCSSGTLTPGTSEHAATAFKVLHTHCSNSEARTKLVAEVDAFGRGRELHHQDIDKFPYVEVREEVLELPALVPLAVHTPVASGAFTLPPHTNLRQAALQEALRLNPPGWMTSRECAETIDIGGWTIPKGSVVYIDIRGIQRDPGEWLRDTRFRSRARFRHNVPLPVVPHSAMLLIPNRRALGPRPFGVPPRALPAQRQSSGTGAAPARSHGACRRRRDRQ